MGHEFSGEVVDIGKNVTNVKIGDRVVVESMDVCGKCPARLEIKYNPNDVVLTEKKIIGSICYCNDFPSTIAMMADNRIKAEGYITKKIYIDDIVKEGFGTLTGPDKKAQVKIIVTPDKSLL